MLPDVVRPLHHSLVLLYSLGLGCKCSQCRLGHKGLRGLRLQQARSQKCLEACASNGYGRHPLRPMSCF